MTIETVQPLILHSPAGEEALKIRNMTFIERLSHPFEVHLELLAFQEEINPDDLLGQPVDIEVAREADGFDPRFINGFVTQIELEEAGVGSNLLGAPDVLSYRVIVQPWLSLLARVNDCRIFLDQSVPDIIQDVFDRNGFSDYELNLFGNYAPRVNCVQYRESCFNFVSRLMEDEGMCYYFKHEQGKHTLVITDSTSGHEALPNFSLMPFNSTGEGDIPGISGIMNWRSRKRLRSGSAVLGSFDFTNINKDLVAPSPDPESHQHGEYEVYDYDARYLEKSDGERYARMRVEAFRTARLSAMGFTEVREISPGFTFELEGHVASAQNMEYLITAATHRAGPVDYASSPTNEPFRFSTEFEALDKAEQFRPARKTPSPKIQGPQTAIVTGPGGQEIHCNEHGQIKAHFHWDRHRPFDDTSSCWIRVSQTYAGVGWGSVEVPRIGQEVIIEFEDSDPDRPIVTGRVYNGNNAPPFELPGKNMVSGIKSNSTPGGGGYNEFTMDDTAGNELINLHGQFNMSSVIENDETAHIKNNRTMTVDVDHAETIGANQTIDVGADQTISVGGNRTDSVGGDETHDVGGNEAVTIGADNTIDVGSNQTISAGSNIETNAGSDMTHSAGANFAGSAGADMTLDGGANLKASSGANTEINAGAEMKLTASAKITLSAGGSTIEIGPAGVTISTGAMVTVNGSLVKLNC